MNASQVRLLVVAVVAAMIGTAGCWARGRSEPVAFPIGASLPESALLDVQILPFDPGVEAEKDEDEEDADERVQAATRQAEASYFPCLLRATLIGTGQWGAVEIAPRRSDAFELTINGRIRESNGEKLEVEIDVMDASDRLWLRQRYEVETEAAQHEDPHRDPYQEVFDSIATDLADVRSRLTRKQLEDIRTIAELRFANDFAPDSLGGYLEEEDKTLRIVRLPAHGDPTLALLGEARGREAMFIATQSSHYDGFCTEMKEPYDGWRKIAREEMIEYRKLRNQAILRKVGAAGLLALTVVAGMYAPGVLAEVAIIAGAASTVGVWQSGSQKQSEADFHNDTLTELNESFESEVAPMVVAVEGRTVKLSGTVEEQYDEWRRLLRELYEADAQMPRGIEFVNQNEETSGTDVSLVEDVNEAPVEEEIGGTDAPAFVDATDTPASGRCR